MAQRTDKHYERIGRYREMSTELLQHEERELAENIFRLRFALVSGQSEGLKSLRDARRRLARVKTLLQARELRKENE